MTGTINCVYETPCGWCSKWDKECDKKMHTRNDRINHPKPIVVLNKACERELDHEWKSYGTSSEGTLQICQRCGKHRIFPNE